jgi:hypothetical protein
VEDREKGGVEASFLTEGVNDSAQGWSSRQPWANNYGEGVNAIKFQLAPYSALWPPGGCPIFFRVQLIKRCAERTAIMASSQYQTTATRIIAAIGITYSIHRG